LEVDIDGDGVADGSLLATNFNTGFVAEETAFGIRLIATPEFNEIIGTEERDTLSGTDGNDRILGLGGDDFIRGSLGNDTIDGGNGSADAVSYRDLTTYAFDIDLSAGLVEANDAFGNSFVDQLSGIENARGSEQDDVLIGTDQANSLRGFGGNDVIEAGAERDVIYGGAGDDIINAGPGDDLIFGGPGFNTIDGGDGVDTANYFAIGILDSPVSVNLQLGIATGQDDNGDPFEDRLVNIENVSGSLSDDVIVGDNFANVIAAQDGDDVVNAGGGNDLLVGHDGNDQLFGEAGNDTIRGGDGADQLTGGDGADVFSYAHGLETIYGDVIQDLTPEDAIQIWRQIGPDSVTPSSVGTEAFTGVAGQIRWEQVGADTVVEVDADGDGSSDGFMTLLNYSGGVEVETFSNRIELTAAPVEPPTPGTNLLTNGSFENPVLPEEGFGGFETVEGWNAITDGQIEIWSNRLGIEATDGVNFLELDYVDGQDGFSQSVGTVAGQDYTLTFDTRLSEAQDIASQGIQVVWNGEVIATVYPGSTEWEEMSFTVTGTGGSDTLTIREPGDGTQNDGLGALLDNFALVADATEAAMASTVKLTSDLAEGGDIIDGGEASSDFVSTVFEASANQAVGQGSGSNPLEAAYLAHHVQSVAAALIDNVPGSIGAHDYDLDMAPFSVDDSLVDASWDIA